MFNGANKSIKTNADKTPHDLLEQAYANEVLEDDEYRSLNIILNQGEQCACFMRHRPLKKIKKQPSIMLYGLITNILVMAMYYYALWRESKDEAADE